MNIPPKTSYSKSVILQTEFGNLYNDYYVLLCVIADNYLKDKYLAEEAVGEVFLNFWEKYDTIFITTSPKAYLVRAVKNWCYNYIEHQKVEQKLKDKVLAEKTLLGLAESSNYPLGCLYEKELADEIAKSINSLPEKCREIFILSRDEELSYEEIAERLKLSINTIKTQIKIALAKLREMLKDYLFIALVILTSIFSG